jgi:glycosyltransferase involved in cell wall biosynthesis
MPRPDVAGALREPLSKPLTVMQLVLTLSPGGTERLVVELVKRLPTSFRTVVCCLDEPGAWGQELIRTGATVLSLKRGAGFRPMLARRIASIAATYGVDVIHCHHYSPFVYGQLAARLLPKLRVVFTEHGRLSDAGPSRKRRIANQLLARLPASVYTVSEDLRSHLASEGFAPERVGVISNGIDVGRARSKELRARVRETLGLAADTFVVGTVGRLDPVKDLGVLVEGFGRFHATSPQSTLIVAGEGTERERLTQLAARLGLSEAVRFLGHREDVRDLLQAFDVYAGTSVFEGVSLTILEAMAAELPVIATAVGGTPEVVINDETGLLIPTRRPDTVADALRFLRDAPELAGEWGRAGRRRVLAHFTIDGMVQAYARIYAGKDS